MSAMSDQTLVLLLCLWVCAPWYNSMEAEMPSFNPAVGALETLDDRRRGRPRGSWGASSTSSTRMTESGFTTSGCRARSNSSRMRSCAACRSTTSRPSARGARRRPSILFHRHVADSVADQSPGSLIPDQEPRCTQDAMSVPWGCTRELLLVDYGKCGVVWLVDLFQLYFMEAIKNFMSLTLITLIKARNATRFSTLNCVGHIFDRSHQTPN